MKATAVAKCHHSGHLIRIRKWDCIWTLVNCQLLSCWKDEWVDDDNNDNDDDDLRLDVEFFQSVHIKCMPR